MVRFEKCILAMKRQAKEEKQSKRRSCGRRSRISN
jgi:hypothetical protein